MENRLKEIVRAQKNGRQIGIYSACSGNPFVIKAVLKRARQDGSPALIEATANQCDQFGGYTGKTPEDFKKMVYEYAEEIGFDTEKLFLGGDHLGPLTFAGYDEEKAMQLAEELVYCYVKAGFTKIHLDTSMKVASDNPDERLSDETIANRTVRLAKVCRKAFEELKKENSNAVRPVFIIGSEVPIPGGQTKTVNKLEVTNPDDCLESLKTFERKFRENDLSDLWDDVIGFVVQPGIEENDTGCVPYIRENARKLSLSLNDNPNIIFEAHSTDYQSKEHLKELVEDGFAILKVGPGLTFALREGLFALAEIEEEKDIKDKSDFINILDEAMIRNPKYWIKHYHGCKEEIAFKRKYSHSDRCRYYLAEPEVAESIDRLLTNLENSITINDLKKHMPVQYEKVLAGKLELNPEALLLDKVINTIDDYLYATDQKEIF